MKKVVFAEKTNYYLVNDNKDEFWKLRGDRFGEKHWKRFFKHPYIICYLKKKKRIERKLKEFW
jgi:hypothetical protein